MTRRREHVFVRVDYDGQTFRVHAEGCPDGRPHGERGVYATTLQSRDELPRMAEIMTRPKTGVEIVVEPCLDGQLPQ
jgi:hypothetical protein